jgi:hypothetical protein
MRSGPLALPIVPLGPAFDFSNPLHYAIRTVPLPGVSLEAECRYGGWWGQSAKLSGQQR